MKYDYTLSGIQSQPYYFLWSFTCIVEHLIYYEVMHFIVQIFCYPLKALNHNIKIMRVNRVPIFLQEQETKYMDSSGATFCVLALCLIP